MDVMCGASRGTCMLGGPDIAETSNVTTEAYGTKPFTPPILIFACGGTSACIHSTKNT